MKKYEFVYEKLKQDILAGYLKRGEVLPSIRQSTELFGVSKTTIEHAYDRLILDGYIKSLPQKGYVVDINPHRLAHYQMQPASNENQDMRIKYDFRLNSVSLEAFNLKIWKRYMKDVFQDTKAMATYGDAQGEKRLRFALSDYAYHQRGVLSSEENILVGSSFQTLLYQFCSLCPKSLTIGMEEHVDSQVLYVFRSFGFKCVLFNSYSLIEDLETIEVDLLYINSSCFGPDFRYLDRETRDALIDISYRRKFLILEDDYNGELNYRSKPRHSLQGASPYDNVIYFGSFSRLLLPSLRLSYMVLNRAYLQRYLANKEKFGPTSSKFEQLALARYMEDGHMEKHLRKLKKEYAFKEQITRCILEKNFSNLIFKEVYFCYCIQIPHIDPNALMKTCCRQEIALDPVENQTLSLSFASLEQNDLIEGLGLLVKILKR